MLLLYPLETMGIRETENICNRHIGVQPYLYVKRILFAKCEISKFCFIKERQDTKTSYATEMSMISKRI